MSQDNKTEDTFHQVQIKTKGVSWRDAEIMLDGKPFKGIQVIECRIAVDELVVCKVEFLAKVALDVNAQTEFAPVFDPIIQDSSEQQELYELMQAYRHIPIMDQRGANQAFKAVMDFMQSKLERSTAHGPRSK